MLDRREKTATDRPRGISSNLRVCFFRPSDSEEVEKEKKKKKNSSFCIKICRQSETVI